jgi:hypothetical protein
MVFKEMPMQSKKRPNRVVAQIQSFLYHAKQPLLVAWAVFTGVVFAMIPSCWLEKDRAWHRRGIRLRVSTSSSFKPGTAVPYKSYHLQFNNGAGYRGGATLTFIPVGHTFRPPYRTLRYWVSLTNGGNGPLPGPGSC